MSQYIQKENCDATELDGEWIILNTENFTVTKLNEVGGLCWTLLNEVQSVDSLSERIGAQFSGSTPIEQVKTDVEHFLTKLSQCGLIDHVD